MTVTNTTRLTANMAQIVMGKLEIVADEPDLQADYNITQQQADELIASIPAKGGTWTIPAATSRVVREELNDMITIWATDIDAGDDNERRAAKNDTASIHRITRKV
jgi:hypothetical protein